MSPEVRGQVYSSSPDGLLAWRRAVIVSGVAFGYAPMNSIDYIVDGEDDSSDEE